MAFTSTKMSLRVWNLLTDLYDHAQLADNWFKVDYHDHSPGKGVQIPTEGIADAAITSVKLSASTDPSGAYLSAKPIVRMGAQAPTTQAAGTFPLKADFSTGVSAVPVPSLTSAVYLDPTHWAASGRTARYLLRGHVLTNATAPTATYAFALYPVGTWGGASSAAPTIATLGTLVPGSTTPNIVAPAASGPTGPVSIEFDAPTAGWYTIVVIQTGAAVGNSLVNFISTLFAKQV